MPRFVILEHDHPTLHWDLMFEEGAGLRTWRLARPPVPPGQEDIPATAVAVHRLAYLDYEGPVSGQRGTVKRWDGGSYELIGPPTPSVLVMDIRGERVHGRARLALLHGDAWSFSGEFSAAPTPEAVPGAEERSAQPPADTRRS
jgi:hypothetical protein